MLIVKNFLKTKNVQLDYPIQELERMKYKSQRMIPCPNSFFMRVKCPKCNQISILFSHSQTNVHCDKCQNLLCQTTGGKTKLTEGCTFKK
mmetsp:Transcript_40426/g.80981  ORF Transcript_40426/g.80981 Transcript_40426/m.80981 type:complete len:90 (-) Transcript_40426:807-1076(-)